MTEQPQHGDRVRVTISGTWRQQDCDGTPAIRTTRATDDDWLLAVPDDAHVEMLPPLPNETEATEPEDTCQPVEADGELQNRLRLAHQARRAKEHQLDDIRRALCDAEVIKDDDPYSHADLADVVRSLGPAAEEALANEQRARAEDARPAPALQTRLHEAIEPILDEYPEHNRTDEHEAILSEIITAVLGVVCPTAAGETSAPARSPLLGQIYEAMKERYLDNALDLGQTSPKQQIKALADVARSVAVSHGQVLAAQHRDAEEQLLAARTRAQEVEDERDGAYRERAHLVALLAAMTPRAVIAPAADVDDEDGWQIAYLTIGGRQASWHISPRDAELFTAVEHVAVDDPRAQWDGHTTEEKYERIAELARQDHSRTHVELHVQPDSPHVAEAIRDIRRHGGPPRRS